MQSYWFGDVERGRCTPATGDIEALSARVLSIRTRMDRFTPLCRTQAIACGIVSTDEEYRNRLHDLSMYLARKAIARQYQVREIGLLQMTRMLDELDSAINLLTERAVEWYGTKDLSFSRKYKKIPAKRVILKMKQKSSGAFGELVRELEGLGNVRISLSREISDRASEVLPNCSALVG
ncbi:MAG: RNA-processing protein, partial [Methanoregulaceae archaeon]|nr:RNA-processing protein [Methanoregulaceae archaeon]